MMFDRDPLAAPVDELIKAGRDGLFALPKAVEAAATREAELRAKAQSLTTVERGQVGVLIERLSDELAAGSDAGDIAATIAKAETAERRVDIEQRVYVTAHAKAQRLKIATVVEAAPTIMRALQAGFEELLDKVRSLTELRGLPVDDAEAFLDTKDPARRAVIALRRARDRFDAIVNARRQLQMVTRAPQRDTEGLFSVLRDPKGVFGDRWRGRHLTAARPWPKGRLAYLVWLAEQDAWLPDADQQDSAAEALAHESRQPVGSR
ncbi:MAG: hypothetical protein ABI725_02310 [Chloroflexota bacterium]